MDACDLNAIIRLSVNSVFSVVQLWFTSCDERVAAAFTPPFSISR
jgi:hypothetical protein